jgi:nicotinamidase-related amidase
MTAADRAGTASAVPAPAEAARFVAGAEPYPWPYDGGLAGARLALLVAGGQRWWAERTHEAGAAVAALARLRRLARAAGALVVLLGHVAPPGSRPGRPALPASRDSGAELAIRPEAGDVVIPAAGLDGFFGSALDATLRAAGRDRLLVAGLGLEGPVHSTLRAANDRGYECLLVPDACSCADPELRAASISSVRMSGGIFGAVASLDAVHTALSDLAYATTHAAMEASP